MHADPQTPGDLAEDYLTETNDRTPSEMVVPVAVVEPVKIVEDRPRRTPTGSHPVRDTTAVRVLQAVPDRLRTVLKVDGARVWYGDEQSTCAFPLDPGESLVTHTVGDMWFRLDAGAGSEAVVYYLTEQR